MTVLLASMSVATAVWLVRPDDEWLLRARLGGEVKPPSRTVVLTMMMAAAVALLCRMLPALATRAAVVAMAGAAGWIIVVRRRLAIRSAARAFREDAARVIQAVAGELDAGMPASAAVVAVVGEAAEVWRPLGRVAPGEVPDVLRRLSGAPGGSGLMDAAAAWELAERSGAPLAGVLRRVADAMRDDLELDREVGLEAVPARATGTLMATLPLFGVGLGAMVGAHPLRVLLTTWLGVACLAGGLLLSCVGVWWVDRIVSAAEAGTSEAAH